MSRIQQLEDLLNCHIIRKIEAGESLEKYHAKYNDREVMIRIYEEGYYGNRFLREGLALRLFHSIETQGIMTPKIVDEWPEYNIRLIEWLDMEPISPTSSRIKKILNTLKQLNINLPYNLKDDLMSHLRQTEGIHVAYKEFFEEKVDKLLEVFDWKDGAEVLVHGDLHLQNLGMLSGYIVLYDWEYASFGSEYYDMAYFDAIHPDLNYFNVNIKWKLLSLLVNAHWHLQERQFSPKHAISWIDRIGQLSNQL